MLDLIEKTIVAHKADKVIFLGDYFDKWGDSAHDAARTATWLVESLKQENHIHLFGNHDVGYAYPDNASQRCSGHTFAKQHAVDAVCPDWNKLKLYHFEDHTLFTHAGLSQYLLPQKYNLSSVKQWLLQQMPKVSECLREGRSHKLLGVGSVRGGSASTGGLTWCDIREFEPLTGQNQVFGHTPLKKCINISEMMGQFGQNWCIDTNSGQGDGPRQYMTIEDGKFLVHNLREDNDYQI